jgi:protein-S-isoprenylcysteine O-methyltransferase Ste14
MQIKHEQHDHDHSHEHAPYPMTRGPLIAGLLLLFLGIYFLLERAGLVPTFQVSWPIILIIIGVALVVSYLVSMGRR